MSEEISQDRIEKMLWEVTGHKIDASQMDAVRVVVEARAVQLAELWRNAPTPVIEAYLGTLNTLASQLLDTGGRMRLHPEGQLDVPAPWATRDDIKSLDFRLKTVADAAVSLGGQSDVLLEIEARIMTKLDELRRPSDIDAIMEALRSDPSVLIKRTAAPAPVLDLADWERDLLEGNLPEPEPLKTSKRNLVPTAGNFFNDDGTITCRTCGVPKTADRYYRDKHAATGFKSACKDCEREQKQKAAA